MLSENSSTKYKEEFIRNWVITEILSQISNENKLLSNENYFRIIENSKKELAAAVAIQNYLENNPIDVNESELNNYFQKNVDDFSFSDDGYVINYVEFKNESNAIKFRNKAISQGWESALSEFENDSSLVTILQNHTFKLSEIQSIRTSRVLSKLYKNEISLVVQTELNNFIVVQQIEKIAKNSVPKFEFIKDKVKTSFLILKQKELVNSYLDSLISQKNVKIF
ncbi:MAG: peptidyl-prolyl cis-trans isomerase [Ignavibacteriae bacterium]|nr:peptidyl-prolyl cis-trans isomerase [Ignavibacteriota bacterium]MCB9209999.1 peptidyl-prolyl cis-trans isomerase [Ignavibacteriales bacterium]MCB9218616.1 peptidyl-prolyl cis-trans isomerase [Ignavibacteriales bacterium]MCB9259378.1 peptidyl-prolyl cis-trans isomerase [Ignavibacteriales bacterium]